MEFGISRARAVRCSLVSAPGVVQIIRLQREGALGRGDLVATRRLGTCEVVSIASAHALTVRALDKHTHDRISGIDFGTGTRLSEV